MMGGPPPPCRTATPKALLFTFSILCKWPAKGYSLKRRETETFDLFSSTTSPFPTYLSLAGLCPCPVGTSCPAACSWGWWGPQRFPGQLPHYRWESPPGLSPWRSSSSVSAWPSPWDVLRGCCCLMRSASCHLSHFLCFCWQPTLHCLLLQIKKSHSGHLPLLDFKENMGKSSC